MNEQEFEKAFSDPDFVNMLLNFETGEEVKKALADKGINLSPDELDKFAEMLVCALQKGKELKNEDLSKISGGTTKGFEQIGRELKISDEEVKGLVTIANVGMGVEKAVADKGITLTSDELVKFNKILAGILKNSKGLKIVVKLNDDALNGISGGFIDLSSTYNQAKKSENNSAKDSILLGSVALAFGKGYDSLIENSKDYNKPEFK